MKKKVYLECLTKKGISPLIATVLLIGFTITIAALVINWGNLFAQDLSTQTSYELASGLECSKTINLAIEDACIVGNQVKVTITNKADITLKGAIIRIFNPNNLVNQTDHTVDIGPYQTISLDSLYSGLPKDLKEAEITLIPKIDVLGNTEICPGKSTKFTNGLCPNLIRYGSFEGVNVLRNYPGPNPSDPQVWFTIVPNSGGPADNNELFGTKVFKINTSSSQVSDIYQIVNITNGQEYTVTGWLKMLSPIPSTGQIRIIFLDPSCSGFSYSTQLINSPTANWVYLRKDGIIGCGDQAVILLEAFDTINPNSALFDAIQFYES